MFGIQKKANGQYQAANWVYSNDSTIFSESFENWLRFIRRFEELLVTGKLEIENNVVGNKSRIVARGAPRKCPSMRKELFINIWPSLKARLPKKILLSKVESLYRDYCEWKREEDVEPENRSFRKEWLKDGAKGTKF